MENTRRSAANWTKAGNRIIRAAVIALTVFVICRCPIMGASFPAAAALISCMVARSPLNILAAVPAAAGIVPYVFRGYDPWGDLAAAAVCGVLFLVSRHLQIAVWQKALIASSVTIVCISIYRLATVTVYKIDLGTLLLEGFLVFAMFLIFDVIYDLAVPVISSGVFQSEKNIYAQFGAPEDLHSFHDAKGTIMISITVTVLMAFNGAGMGFAIWPLIVFEGLWILMYASAGDAVFTVLTGGITASLLEQDQWGFMITVMTGLAAASAVKKYGTAAATGVFAIACGVMQFAESGVILGIDNYCLFSGCGLFLIINWKYGSVMKRIVSAVFFSDGGYLKQSEKKMKELMEFKIMEMQEMADLYSTYLDSRSMLADQFRITEQIIEDLQIKMGSINRREHDIHEKFRMDISISQLAASGIINGDCCGWHDIGKGRTAMVVSDGMGKGKKAAAESLMVTRTIISLLKSGVTAELTLKMINTIMLMKENEDFYATVDLIIVDRKNGRTKFYKIGAAPTLIKRREHVEEVRLSAVPLGIVNGLKIRYLETTLKKEDWIIMMSDGVSDGGTSRTSEDSRAFLHHLKRTAAEVQTTDPQIMSRLMLERAEDSYRGRERDDLTVMVARLF